MRTRSITASISAAALALTGLAVIPPAHAVGGDGTLVLIGGALDENAEILRSIVQHADPDGNGPLTARIAVVTAASVPAGSTAEGSDPANSNAAANGLYYAQLFESYGATTYAVPIDIAVDFVGDPYTPQNADSAAVAAEVRASTGVFFSGGDQSRYVETLMDCQPAPYGAFTNCSDSPVLAAVRDVLDAGGVVAGSSAGLTIQNGPDMITGGESYEAWRYGAYAGQGIGSDDLTYLPYGGFGFFTEGLLDSHFGNWGRQGRIIELARDRGRDLAVGVDETTALVYDRATRVGSVIGLGGVSVLDISAATFSGASALGIRWDYLVRGDSIDFRTLGVAAGAAKRAGAGSAAAPALVRDIWDSPDGRGTTSTMVGQAQKLVKSSADVAQGTTYERNPRYRVYLDRVSGTSWWATGGFEGLEVDIVPN